MWVNDHVVLPDTFSQPKSQRELRLNEFFKSEELSTWIYWNWSVKTRVLLVRSDAYANKLVLVDRESYFPVHELTEEHFAIMDKEDEGLNFRKMLKNHLRNFRFIEINEDFLVVAAFDSLAMSMIKDTTLLPKGLLPCEDLYTTITDYKCNSYYPTIDLDTLK